MRSEQAILLISKVTDSNWHSRIENLKDIISIANTLLFDRDKRIGYFETERLQMSDLLMQKILLHGSTILANAEGINFPSKHASDFQIKDPFSLNVLFRSLLESYLTLNHFNFSQSEDENDIRFKIWMQHGFRQRAKMTFYILKIESEELLKKEASDIDKFIEEIISSRFYLSLDRDKQETFLQQIIKDWKFGFRGSTYLKYSWQELLINTGVNKVLFNDTYNFLSWFSHSNCISLYQLKEIYNENKETLEVSKTLLVSTIIIALALSDYIIIDKELKFEFDRLSHEEKNLINIYNLHFRDESYTIDFIKE